MKPPLQKALMEEFKDFLEGVFLLKFNSTVKGDEWRMNVISLTLFDWLNLP